MTYPHPEIVRQPLWFGQVRTNQKPWGAQDQLRVSRRDLENAIAYLDEVKSDWLRVDFKIPRQCRDTEWTRYGQVDTFQPAERADQPPRNAAAQREQAATERATAAAVAAMERADARAEAAAPVEDDIPF